jgi:2-oxo-4-hydroxy-4-carboxy-5-ureidoimidazoline decarboxylase
MTAQADLTLNELNNACEKAFVATLGSVFEHAPWVAEGVLTQRPFATISALHAAMCAVVTDADDATQMAFLNAHPELGGAAARRSAMAALSVEEQATLGLQALDEALSARFDALNTAYRQRFGFPFIICVRRHTLSSIITQFERRVTQDVAMERQTALMEISHITRRRLEAMVDGPGRSTQGWLSTHVLNAATGRPAAGVSVELSELDGDRRITRAATVTNADGRTDRPLIAQGDLRIGHYELRFGVGAYFAGALPEEPAFLGIVPIRFGVSEPEAHYHVPLLVSPGAYSTYRGS